MAHVVQDIKLIPNAEAFTFIPISAFTKFLDSWNVIPKNLKPFQLHPEDIPKCDDNNDVNFEECMTEHMLKFTRNQFKLLGFESGWIYNTSRVIEGRYVNLLESLNINMKHFAIGPLHPLVRDVGIKSKHQSLEWLDKQKKGLIHELANGLDECEQKFIWVLRRADSSDIFAQENGRLGEPQLPQEYEEKVKHKGIVVRDWNRDIGP
ncbi:Zeatin O-glucosyltransferase [Bienertia sinuspersici]